MLDLEKKDRLVRELSELSELELQSVIDEFRVHVEKNKMQHVLEPFSSGEKEELEDQLSDLKEERDDYKEKYLAAKETLNEIRDLL